MCVCVLLLFICLFLIIRMEVRSFCVSAEIRYPPGGVLITKLSIEVSSRTVMLVAHRDFEAQIPTSERPG